MQHRAPAEGRPAARPVLDFGSGDIKKDAPQVQGDALLTARTKGQRIEQRPKLSLQQRLVIAEAALSRRRTA